MVRDSVKIMEIPFDKITLAEAINLLLKILANKSSKSFFVATPNPEMVLEAQKNTIFKKILQRTNLNIPDGTGIIWASKIIKKPLPERVTGTDLMELLCQKVPSNTKIFLLGGGKNVAEKTKQKLQKRRKINIIGTYAGSASETNDQQLREIINNTAPELLFVAFGAPKQELWLARNLPHLPSIKVAIGVGGAFDFIAGEKKRAPIWMRRVGLEWLFRLIQQPNRLLRIINATIIFPLTFLAYAKRQNKKLHLNDT